MNCEVHCQDYLGCTAVDPRGIVIGRVVQVYLNNDTGQPQWVAVHTGPAGPSGQFAPLHGSTIDDRRNLVLPFAHTVVSQSPGVANPAQLEVGEHSELYRYYQRYLGSVHQ